MAVSNIGEADGFETVQVYVRDEKSRLPRPEKELVSFEKVFLERDQTRHLCIRLDKYAVGYYDSSVRAWIAEEGRFEVLIGASSADIRLVVSFLLTWRGVLRPGDDTPADPVSPTDEQYRSKLRSPSPGSSRPACISTVGSRYLSIHSLPNIFMTGYTPHLRGGTRGTTMAFSMHAQEDSATRQIHQDQKGLGPPI